VAAGEHDRVAPAARLEESGEPLFRDEASDEEREFAVRRQPEPPADAFFLGGGDRGEDLRVDSVRHDRDLLGRDAEAPEEGADGGVEYHDPCRDHEDEAAESAVDQALNNLDEAPSVRHQMDVLVQQERPSKQPTPQGDDPRIHVECIVGVHHVEAPDEQKASPQEGEREDWERYAEPSLEDVPRSYPRHIVAVRVEPGAGRGTNRARQHRHSVPRMDQVFCLIACDVFDAADVRGKIMAHDQHLHGGGRIRRPRCRRWRAGNRAAAPRRRSSHRLARASAHR
jgi:hypothetical protein